MVFPVTKKKPLTVQTWFSSSKNVLVLLNGENANERKELQKKTRYFYNCLFNRYLLKRLIIIGIFKQEKRSLKNVKIFVSSFKKISFISDFSSAMHLKDFQQRLWRWQPQLRRLPVDVPVQDQLGTYEESSHLEGLLRQLLCR